MEYNKKDTAGKPDRVHHFGGGPRDQQRRLNMMNKTGDGLASEALINELRNQIVNLTKELAKKQKSIGEFSAEEVDEEIRKAVAGAVKETENRVGGKAKELANVNRGLKEEIEKFKSELSATKNKADFDIKELTTEYEKKISNLEVKVRNRDKVIDELRFEESAKIEELTKRVEELAMTVVLSKDGLVDIDLDRPKIEEVFVDPLEKNAGKDLESHVEIGIEDTPLMEKKEMDEKVDKLKGMLGKLPNLKK